MTSLRPMQAVARVAAAVATTVLFATGLAQAQAPLVKPAASAKDIVLNGDAKCTRCHDENDDSPVLAIGKTKHGTRADGRTPACVSCHGDSDTHINKPEGVTVRPKPDVMFKGKSKSDAKAINAACSSCHQGGKRTHWAGSQHETRDVSCSNCHQVHAQHDKVRDKATQPEVCFACHKEQRAQINRPSHHPVKEGKMTCSDCHNPHGAAGEKLLVKDNINETCYACHMEKRGPFLRGHQPVAENCANCHNPHGTSNDNLLKVRAPFLCTQCHEPTSHRGNLPGVTGGSSGSNASGVGIGQARACLNCHTNIHGTNNPASVTNERTFRR